MSIQSLIKQPSTTENTGLDEELLIDLVLKHLYDSSVLDLLQLTQKLKIAGSILECILLKLRKDARVYVSSPQGTTSVRYQLTDLGRSDANNALSRSGYLGPAPITLEHYTQIVDAQSVFDLTLTQKELVEVMVDVVMDETLYDQLGPAVHSGRPILIYGHAGTGKTFICKHLARLLGDHIYLPYAISIGREIIQYFDPLIHQPINTASDGNSLAFAAKADPRLLLCQRPVAISGGELTMERLELSYDPVARISQAPIQMKANNGMYIIDDLGRQSMPPIELLNRWIVPMEEHTDYLSLSTGLQFPVPFNTVLIFSTNLHPLELADEAFLRRLGYKIHFEPIDEQKYTLIWSNIVKERELSEEKGILDCLFMAYQQNKRVLLPCHPRDLIGLALDMAAFKNNKGHLTIDNIKLAWKTYFIELENEGDVNE
ncbi:MAG: hypothetical protein KAJ63_10545 [Methyloprofundus sp.]|nr:hypothetical protein [Methyloprofundus sp.]